MTLAYTAAEVESLRRSAAMAPLPPPQVVELLEDLRTLHRERAAVRALMAELGPAWHETRRRMNELAAVVAGEPTSTG